MVSLKNIAPIKEHSPYPEFITPDPIVSQTGELKWYHGNDKGLVTIESDRAEGLVGFVKTNKKSLKHLDVDISNTFCSIMLISMDEKNIAESGQLLLASTATSGLSGMTYNEARTELRNRGQKPSVIEPVTGKITIRDLIGVKSAEIISIDGNGMIMETKKVKNKSGDLQLNIGKDITPLYLLRIYRE